MSQVITGEETCVETERWPHFKRPAYTLLNGEKSTVMNTDQLVYALFDLVVNNHSVHFTVTEGDGTTFIRVTRGLQG
jgi:hypothetical protein